MSNAEDTSEVSFDITVKIRHSSSGWDWETLGGGQESTGYHDTREEAERDARFTLGARVS